MTAVSAGNRAIATARAACTLGLHAEVVMLAGASPAGVEKVRRCGGEVVPAPDVRRAFALVETVVAEGDRLLAHPFEGQAIVCGTGTLGLDWLDQAGALDALIVPIGGGGLAAGVAAAVKQARPGVLVLGVEPEGADSMARSLEAGSPQRLERVATIADSLGAPFALPQQLRLVPAVLRRGGANPRFRHGRGDGALFRRSEARLRAGRGGAARGPAVAFPSAARGRPGGLWVCDSNIDPDGFGRLLGATL